MSDTMRVDFTVAAAEEVRQLPRDRAAWVAAKVKHVEAVGWQESMRLRLIKKLDGDIYEIIVKGKGPSYRLLCFQGREDAGRIVVVVSCTAKGNMLGLEKRNQIKRAKARRQDWLDSR